jgi:hypothetical protein
MGGSMGTEPWATIRYLPRTSLVHEPSRSRTSTLWPSRTLATPLTNSRFPCSFISLMC